MMALLLKKVRGLNRVTLKNAKFVWTEPHSKRFKLKIDIEREISDKLKVEQT
jgi:nonsense-mediated mRNA decay protein 3